MSASSKQVDSLTREELVEEVTEQRTLIRELMAKIECPVCLTVPREGPLPCCPRGHIICSGCIEKIKEGGGRDCPTCREPMGEGRSLLGKVLVENIKHQCDLKSCKEMVPFKAYKQHKSECKYRLVMCPGSNQRCNEMVSFCEVEHHATTCPDIKPLVQDPHMEYSIAQARQHLGGTYNSQILHIGGEVFFVRARKEAGNFIAEVVMKADQEKCNKFTATISILDSKLRPVYNSSFSPRPLQTSNEEDACLSVGMKSLAKVWKEDGDEFCFNLRVDVKKEDES